MSADDRHLIEQSLAGRSEAFGELVVRYQDRLYNTLVKVLGSHDDARDAAQDAFVQAFQKLSSFQGNSAFYSWLFRIAVNAAISQKRKSKRFPQSVEAARDKSGAEPVDPHPEGRPGHAMETAERQQLVRDALAQLPDEYRTVLVLKEIEGLRYEEIAEAVGCPIGTVRSRIHRARQELREKLLPSLRSDP